jgi:hypothetical protein
MIETDDDDDDDDDDGMQKCLLSVVGTVDSEVLLRECFYG